MPSEDKVFDALVRIQQDTTSIREDVSYLKAKNEETKEDIEDLFEDIEDLSAKLAEISEKKIPEIQSELATLKAKAAIGGAIAGSFLGVVAGLLLRAVDWIGSFFGQ